MTTQEMIKGAMRLIGVLATGETPEAAELADNMAALNTMLRAWSANNLKVYVQTDDSKVLTIGTEQYTIGDTGTWITGRPSRILGARIKDSSGHYYQVDVRTAREYSLISEPMTSGRPEKLFFFPSYPNATIYLYFVPDAAETLYINSIKPWTEITSLTAAISFPAEYEEAIKYNLAIRLAPEYGKSVPAEVGGIAKVALDDIIALNAANQFEPTRLDIARASSGYDINSDTYRGR